MLTRVLFFVWLSLFAASFILTAITPPKDFGLTAGFNRIEVFFKWQIFAGIAGILLWKAGQAFDKGTLWRWLSRAPILFALLLFFMVLFLIIGANLGKPKPGEYYTPPGPVAPPSQPVEPAQPTEPPNL